MCVCGRTSSASLGDVRPDGHHGIAHLRSEAKPLFTRESSSHPVDPNRQETVGLPCLDLPEILHERKVCLARHRSVISLTAAHHHAVISLTAARQRGAENLPASHHSLSTRG